MGALSKWKRRKLEYKIKTHPHSHLGRVRNCQRNGLKLNRFSFKITSASLSPLAPNEAENSLSFLVPDRCMSATLWWWAHRVPHTKKTLNAPHWRPKMTELGLVQLQHHHIGGNDDAKEWRRWISEWSLCAGLVCDGLYVRTTFTQSARERGRERRNGKLELVTSRSPFPLRRWCRWWRTTECGVGAPFPSLTNDDKKLRTDMHTLV